LEVCAVETARKTDWYQSRIKAVKAEVEQYPDHRIENGRLYRHILHTLDFNDTAEKQQWKVCVPSPEQERVLREAHDDPTAGHLGVAKTLVRLAKNYYWPGMLQIAAQYVRNCASCQKASQQLLPGKLHATAAEQPWEVVAVDLIGPLPRSVDLHTWLLVMQDKFTKWIELRPLRKATGSAVAKALREQVILRHGCPRTVITDNGRQFISQEFKTALREAAIKHRLTPPYRVTPRCVRASARKSSKEFPEAAALLQSTSP